MTFLVMYANLFSLGYNWLEYLGYIATKLECLVGIVGIILVCCSFKKGNVR